MSPEKINPFEEDEFQEPNQYCRKIIIYNSKDIRTLVYNKEVYDKVSESTDNSQFPRT